MFNMKRLGIISALIASIGLAGCSGEYAEVPLAYVGKIKTKDGIKPGLINPSQFRLPLCWYYCDKLLLAETSDFKSKESFRGKNNSLYMPKSDLMMEFDVRGTFAVARDDQRLERVFANIPVEATDFPGSSGVITADNIYKTYAVPIIRDVVRRVVVNYSITEINSNRAIANAVLNRELLKEFKSGKIPIDIKRFGLADIRFPPMIVQQKQVAAERRIAIEQEEANKQVALVKLETELETAKAKRAIKRELAQAAAEENKILADSVTPKYLAYKDREILEKLTTSNNTKWISPDILGTMAGKIAVGNGIGNEHRRKH